MSPFGSLLSGYLASHFGAPVALRLAGAACILAAVVFTWRLPSIRRSTP